MTKKTTALILLALFLFASCSILPNDSSKRKYNPMMKYAGVVSTPYGMTPFPDPATIKKAVAKMEKAFPATEPLVLWTVGTANPANAGVRLEFPSSVTNDLISSATNDRQDRYLRYFDMKAINVILMVEPGHAPVGVLIDLVLRRYGAHPCVIGFGVDVEKYNPVPGGAGKKVDDFMAMTWERQARSYNTNYRLVLKHYDISYLPPGYRGDIIFIDSARQFRDAKDMTSRSFSFAERFYPNVVLFLAGSPSDRSWWKRYKRPQEDIGDALTEKVRQEFGLVWSDMTMKDVLLK